MFSQASFHYSSYSHYIIGCTALTILQNFKILVGKVIQKPTRCNNNSFIDLQDQLNMFRANFCPSSGAQDWGFFFKIYGIVSCCCGRQWFGARQRGTTCTVWRKQLPSYRTRSATLPRSKPLPTTTTGHYTIYCKKKTLSLAFLKMGKNLPETCWADLGDQ